MGRSPLKYKKTVRSPPCHAVSSRGTARLEHISNACKRSVYVLSFEKKCIRLDLQRLSRFAIPNFDGALLGAS